MTEWDDYLCDSCHEFTPIAHYTPLHNRLCDTCYSRYTADTEQTGEA